MRLEIWKLSFGVPQGSAQLLSVEGTYVTFYTLESLERGSMVVGDFSTSLRCARNDRGGERFEERELRFEEERRQTVRLQE